MGKFSEDGPIISVECESRVLGNDDGRLTAQAVYDWIRSDAIPSDAVISFGYGGRDEPSYLQATWTEGR